LIISLFFGGKSQRSRKHFKEKGKIKIFQGALKKKKLKKGC